MAKQYQIHCAQLAGLSSVVNGALVAFDSDGISEPVAPEAAELVQAIPGYSVVESDGPDKATATEETGEEGDTSPQGNTSSEGDNPNTEGNPQGQGASDNPAGEAKKTNGGKGK